MNVHRSQKLAELAPLTQSFAVHLATHLLNTLPRRSGRPRRNEMDISERTEARLLEAMDHLIGLVRERQQLVYEMVNQAFVDKILTPKWLMQALSKHMPGETIMYPQRIREWRQSRMLYWSAKGVLDPQSVSRILIARMIDTRKSGWVPRKPLIESYWTWRWNAPGLAPFPYEAPLVLKDNTTNKPIYKSVPEPGPQPYILASSWKGAAWDDPAWVVFNSGAARWVGDTTDEHLKQWISEDERTSLLSLTYGHGQAESLATQILRLIVAKQFPHNFLSNDGVQ